MTPPALLLELRQVPIALAPPVGLEEICSHLPRLAKIALNLDSAEPFTSKLSTNSTANAFVELVCVILHREDEIADLFKKLGVSFHLK